MAGCAGDGVTDDHRPLQEFNDFFFARTLRGYQADFSGEFATTEKIFIGPSSPTDHRGPRYNVSGNLRIVARASLTEICERRNMGMVDWSSGGITVVGTGGEAYSTRTCGIGIVERNNSAGRIGHLVSYHTLHHGIYFPSDRSNFNDNLSVGTLRAYSAGSGGTQANSALSANWSAPANLPAGRWAGSFGQSATIVVDRLPPDLIDDYAGQIVVAIDKRPYEVRSIDRRARTLTLHPSLDPAVVSAGSGTLTYIYGGAYTVAGGDSGIISIDQVHSVMCGIGLGEMSLYGSTIGSATIEFPGIVRAIGRAGAAHVGGLVGNVFAEGFTFDLVLMSTLGPFGFEYLLNSCVSDLARCHNLFSPIDAEGRPVCPLEFDNGKLIGGVTMGFQGKFLSPHKQSFTTPSRFLDHTYNAHPKTFAVNAATIALADSGTGGAFRRLFGIDGNVWTFVGTGPNNAPTGAITFRPPAGGRINGGPVDGPASFAGFDGPVTFSIYITDFTELNWAVVPLIGYRARTSASYGQRSIAPGAVVKLSVPSSGAAPGHLFAASLDKHLDGLVLLPPHVSGPDTVVVPLWNPTGDTIDLPVGTVSVVKLA